MGLFGSRKKNPRAAARAQTGVAVGARLAATPGVQRVAMQTAEVYTLLDFLSPAQCTALIAMIDTNRRPSTLLSDRGGANFRTSESCDMDRWSPDVRPIDEGIARLLGIDPARSETMQGQRYAPGQQFKAHHDYFHEGEPYWEKMKDNGGQRMWTAMIYLNDVPDGGATWFPQAGIRVAPRRGMLLAWNNMAGNGEPNPATVHEGMAVGQGVKYIVTKWFREDVWVGN